MMQFQISSKKEKQLKEHLEFPEKFLANSFDFSDAENNTSTSSPLNREGIADLHLLRTRLAIRQNSRELSFCEVIDSFALLAYASLAASRAVLHRLLACLNFYFRFSKFILLV